MHLCHVRIDAEQFPARDHYPFNVPALAEPRELTLARPVTFFVGENGSGKSTVLEAIVRRCHIHMWAEPRRHMAHHNPDEAELWRYLSVGWVDGPVPGALFSAATFADFTHFLDDIATNDPGQLQYFGGQPLNQLSQGQAMLAYFGSRYRYRGLYFLDEPEASLSPASQVKLVRLLHRYQHGGHAQFIISTHSPILLALPEAQILSFDSDGIREVTREQTMVHRVYSQFLADPAAYLEAE